MSANCSKVRCRLLSRDTIFGTSLNCSITCGRGTSRNWSMMLCNIRCWLELVGTLTTPLCSQFLSEDRSGRTTLTTSKLSFTFCEMDPSAGRCYTRSCQAGLTISSMPSGTRKSIPSSPLKGRFAMPSLTSGSTSRSHCSRNASSTARNDKAFFRPLHPNTNV